MFCQTCGQPINEGEKFCGNCGAPQKNTLPKVKNSSNNNGTQKSHEQPLPVHMRKLPPFQNEDKQSKKFYDKTWFMWLMLFIFGPVGIFLLWKKSKIGIIGKILITFISLLFFIGFYIAPKKESPSQQTTQQQSQAKNEALFDMTVEQFHAMYNEETANAPEMQILYIRENSNSIVGAIGSEKDNHRIRVEGETQSGKIKILKLRIVEDVLNNDYMLNKWILGSVMVMRVFSPDLDDDERAHVVNSLIESAKKKSAHNGLYITRGDIKYGIQYEEYSGMNFIVKRAQ